jgi:hypothetical protein
MNHSLSYTFLLVARSGVTIVVHVIVSNHNNKGEKLNNQTSKAHGQSSWYMKQASRQGLLLIMTILGHDRSNCCCVEDVATAAQNSKSQQQRQQTQQSSATNKGAIILVHETSKQARFAADHDHSWS